MRYLILKPREETFDPRSLKLDNIGQLHDALPPIAECHNEREAISTLRKMFPDAVGMPCDLKIGSGSTLLLCFVEDANVPVDPSGEMDFVAFVQPVPGDDTERKALKRAIDGNVSLVFDAMDWAPKPTYPEIGKPRPVEWRTSELALPSFMDARVGYANGKLVVYLAMGDRSMSITFTEPGLELVDRRKEENDRAADRADAASL